MTIRFGLVYEICRPEPFDGFLSEADAYWQGRSRWAVWRRRGTAIMRSLRLFGEEVIPRFRVGARSEHATA